MDHTGSGPVANECDKNTNFHGFDDKVGTSLKSAILKMLTCWKWVCQKRKQKPDIGLLRWNTY